MAKRAVKFAHGSPAKDFFISMITKDISLSDCILDLLDNSIDGARELTKGRTGQRFKGYRASIAFNNKRFAIEDNCGGISVKDAVDYAFHFGRRLDDPNSRPTKGAIGLYGIGMKRAIFKIGRKISVSSSTKTEGFSVPIDVDAWKKQPDNWDFVLQTTMPNAAGTVVAVERLNDGIGEEFDDPVFATQLTTTIARDYSIFLQSGFQIEVNAKPVQPHIFELLVGDGIAPQRTSFRDGKVLVEIFAGLAAPPPDDLSADDDRGRGAAKKVDYYGWFVACNDRVVLAGDKSEQTVWGDEGFQRWHYQYNGFFGMVRFKADDPALLPWTTTKRGIDMANGLYRRAITEMKKATLAFIEYTTARKGNLDRAQEIERKAKAVKLVDLEKRGKMKLPQITKAKKIAVANIAYSVPREQALEVAEALGDISLRNKAIGEKTFQYFRDREVLG